MWQVTFLGHHINLQQKAVGCSRGRRLCHAITWDLCIWYVRRHILREGQCVFPLPQLHTPCKRHLLTSRERWDGKNTKGGTGAVIKGSVNVILLCGTSKAALSFSQQEVVAPARAGSWPVKMTGPPPHQNFPCGCAPGHTRRLGAQGHEGQLCWRRAAPHLNPGIWPPSGEGGTFPESYEVWGETFENAGTRGEIQKGW